MSSGGVVIPAVLCLGLYPLCDPPKTLTAVEDGSRFGGRVDEQFLHVPTFRSPRMGLQADRPFDQAQEARSPLHSCVCSLSLCRSLRAARGTPIMSHQYVATAKKATAVSKSLVCHFTGPDDLNLVIAKGAHLEIRDITPEGLQHRLDVPLYGAIATMEAYRLPDETIDRLFVLTERYQFCVLQYDAARQV